RLTGIFEDLFMREVSCRRLIDISAKLPIFQSATRPVGGSEKYISITEARVTHNISGRASLAYADRAAEPGVELAGGVPVIVAPGEADAYLTLFADDPDDVSERLHGLSVAAINKRRWEESAPFSPPSIKDPQSVWGRSHEIYREEIEDMTVTVTLSHASTRSEIFYIKDGRLLERKEIAGASFEGVTFYISGPMEVNWILTEPLASDALRQAWERARDGANDLLVNKRGCLSRERRLSLIKSIVTQELSLAVGDAVGPSLWPRLASSLHGIWKPFYSGDARDRLAALGDLSTELLFEDNHGKAWSLDGLQEALDKGSLEAVVYRVEGEPANDGFYLVTTPDGADILRIVLDGTGSLKEFREAAKRRADTEEEERQEEPRKRGTLNSGEGDWKRRAVQTQTFENILAKNRERVRRLQRPGAKSSETAPPAEDVFSPVTAVRKPAPAVEDQNEEAPAPSPHAEVLKELGVLVERARRNAGLRTLRDLNEFLILEASDGSRIARVSSERAIVDGNHPAVARLLEEPDDRVALGMVTYGVLCELVRFYDADSASGAEVDFLLAMTRGFHGR
ncbi:MAG: hypothetical protein ACNA8W_01640, partial [Bradymonadaceae bacterium]